MDLPSCPDRGANSDFSFLIAVLTAALLGLETLCRAERGQQTGFYPLRCAESSLTLGTSGFFLTQTLRDLADTDPQDRAACQAARGELLAAGLVFAAALIQFRLVQYRRKMGLLPDQPLIP